MSPIDKIFWLLEKRRNCWTLNICVAQMTKKFVWFCFLSGLYKPCTLNNSGSVSCRDQNRISTKPKIRAICPQLCRKRSDQCRNIDLSGQYILHFLSIYLICSDKFAILEFSFPLQKFAYRESFSEVSGRIHRHQTFPKSVIKRMAIIYNLSPRKLSTSSINLFCPRAAPNNLSGFLHFRFLFFQNLSTPSN